jgi:hypothetical protein
MSEHQKPVVPRLRDRDEVLAWLRTEYAHPFAGWDFSHIRDRYTENGVTPWSYEDECVSRIRSCRSVIDVATGDGVLFAQLLGQAGMPPTARATEAYRPNLPLARRSLEPLGVEVLEATGASLPVDDRSVDLILNRHGGFDAAATFRALTPGGTLVTQQVGNQTNREIHDVLGAPSATGVTYATLAEMREAARSAGLTVERAEEAVIRHRYMDAGALVWYLKAIPWEIPDFDVDRYADRLVQLHQRIESEGPLDVSFHTVFLIAYRRG